MERKWLHFSTLSVATIIAIVLIGFGGRKESQYWPVPSNEKKIKKDSGEDEKKDSPRMFARFENEIRTRDGASKPAYKLGYKIVEMKKVGILDANGSGKASRLGKSATGLAWVERGPANVGGRTRGLIVDPDDGTHNTWFAGSVGGGIWKTTNSGGSWENKTPDQPNLATTVLAMAASDHNTIYCGTGEGFGNADAIAGDGIFKSTDHGDNWNQVASTAGNTDFQYVNRIIVKPTDPNTVLACTETGIYRSTNGGTSWDQVYNAISVQHLIANPLNFNTQFASVNGFGVVKSVDGGVTWSSSKTGLGAGFRYELAIAPSDTTRIYAAVESSGGSDLYLSDNAGGLWYFVSEQSGAQTDWLGGQGWYDNTITVNPYFKDSVFVGGSGSVQRIAILAGGSTTGSRTVDTVGTASFLNFVPSTMPFLGGGVGTGDQFFSPTLPPTGITAGDTTFDVEIRFGPGITQKAHRFLFGASFAYRYQDYVEVPFQAWDVTNNRQLMVSFRDRDSNGVWDIFTWDGVSADIPRDYLFVNAVPYNASTPDPNIAQFSGQVYKCIVGVWAYLHSGTWNPNNLPTSKIIFDALKTVTTKLRNSTAVIDAYGEFNSANPNVHPDHHNLTAIPVLSPSFRILDGNDGGLAMSTNSGKTWTIDQGSVIGYNTTQFYGVDKKAGANQYIGGTQDNGTWGSPVNPSNTSSWTEVLGGDGFDAVWQYSNANNLIGSIYNDRLYRSTDGGANWNALTSLPDYNNGPFITQIGRSKQDPDLIFTTGPGGVSRSDDFGTTWSSSPISASNWGYSTLYDFVEVSVRNPQIVWAGARMSSAGKINVSRDGGLSFTPTVNYPTVTLGRISGLATHPTEDSTAFALFSIADAPKILRTTDLGKTWTDISGFGTNPTSSNGFPNVATYCLLVMPDDPTEIWAGTEIGIFKSTDSGANWAYANNGIPPASIWEMKIVDQEIIVATHGRGIWSVTRNTVPALPVVTLSPRLNALGQSPSTGALSIGMTLRSVYDSVLVKVNGATFVKLNVASVKDTSVNYPVIASATVPVQIVGYKGGQAYLSLPKNVSIVASTSAQATYTNNFNAASTDFSGNGFTISTASGFLNGAINSPHPYSDNTDYYYQLGVPIIVSSDTSKMISFDEVAIVEPGDPGSVFGDPNFWDYTTVQGTSDGVTWVNLEDGWDCRLHTSWLTSWNSSGNGSSTQFFNHRVRPIKKFAAGTSIFIRFFLHADEASHGWGWVIDNLKINTDLTAPQLTVSALASPVVNVVRFGIGANEPISSAQMVVNLVALPMVKDGKLFFGNYTIAAPGDLAVLATAFDTAANSTSSSHTYSVTQLSKASVIGKYVIAGTGEGYLLTTPFIPASIPSNWTQMNNGLEMTTTGPGSLLDVKANYDVSSLKVRDKDFDELKIGFYEFTNGVWKYAGGEGSSQSLSAKLNAGPIAVFYNPDHVTVPKDFALEQNYPNPFNPTTTIRYAVPFQSRVVIRVYNMLGQEVKTVVNESKPAGRYQIVWDGKNEFGNAVASGVYLYRLEAGDVVKVKKMLLLK